MKGLAPEFSQALLTAFVAIENYTLRQSFLLVEACILQ
jgi:hypothetical protein